jgi:hypothetical protein
MALLETCQRSIISKSWYCVRRPISLCHIVLFDANFQLHSIQAPLSAFAYLVQIAQIKSARPSLHSILACTLRGMAPTPHAIMLRSQKMWLKVSFTIWASTLQVCIVNQLGAYIPLHECMSPNFSNSILLIVMEQGQRVT